MTPDSELIWICLPQGNLDSADVHNRIMDLERGGVQTRGTSCPLGLL